MRCASRSILSTNSFLIHPSGVEGLTQREDPILEIDLSQPVVLDRVLERSDDGLPDPLVGAEALRAVLLLERPTEA